MKNAYWLDPKDKFHSKNRFWNTLWKAEPHSRLKFFIRRVVISRLLVANRLHESNLHGTGFVLYVS